MNDKKNVNYWLVISIAGALMLVVGILLASFDKSNNTVPVNPKVQSDKPVSTILDKSSVYLPVNKEVYAVEGVSLLTSDQQCVKCVAFLQNKCEKGMRKYIRERNICIASCNEIDEDGKLFPNSVQCYDNCRTNYGGDDGLPSSDVAICLAFMDKQNFKIAQAIKSCVKCSNVMGLQ